MEYYYEELALSDDENNFIQSQTIELSKDAIDRELHKNTFNVYDMLKFSRAYIYVATLLTSVLTVILEAMTYKLFLGILSAYAIDTIVIGIYILKIKNRILYRVVNIFAFLSFIGLVIYLYVIDYCICLLNEILNNYVGGVILFTMFQFLSYHAMNYNRLTKLYILVKYILFTICLFLHLKVSNII